jgi:hypothetical protein
MHRKCSATWGDLACQTARWEADLNEHRAAMLARIEASARDERQVAGHAEVK